MSARNSYADSVKRCPTQHGHIARERQSFYVDAKTGDPIHEARCLDCGESFYVWKIRYSGMCVGYEPDEPGGTSYRRRELGREVA